MNAILSILIVLLAAEDPRDAEISRLRVMVRLQEIKIASLERKLAKALGGAVTQESPTTTPAEMLPHIRAYLDRADAARTEWLAATESSIRTKTIQAERARRARGVGPMTQLQRNKLRTERATAQQMARDLHLARSHYRLGPHLPPLRGLAVGSIGRIPKRGPVRRIHGDTMRVEISGKYYDLVGINIESIVPGDTVEPSEIFQLTGIGRATYVPRDVFTLHVIDITAHIQAYEKDWRAGVRAQKSPPATGRGAPEGKDTMKVNPDLW